MTELDVADVPTGEETEVDHRHPNQTFSVTVEAEMVELSKTSRVVERDADGDHIETTESETIVLPIEDRQINQYTDFEATSESFESTAASKSDTEKIALVEVYPDQQLQWHNLVATVELELEPVYDDSVWDWELPALPAVRVSTAGRSDTYRSQTSRKVRVGREAVDTVRDGGGRLLVVTWREASGASRGSSSWSKFQPRSAVELQTQIEG